MRRRTVRSIAAFAILAGASSLCSASISEYMLARYAGYTIVGSFTITGWYDTGSEGKKGDSFEGCNYGRVIVLDNSKTLTCAGYSYHYAYRPDALVLVRNGNFKMIVETEEFDMNH
jgi:hypothetical protein